MLYNPDAKRLIIVPPGEAKKLACDKNNQVRSITLGTKVKSKSGRHAIHSVEALLAITDRSEFKDTAFEIDKLDLTSGRVTMAATQSRELLKEAFGGDGIRPYTHDISGKEELQKIIAMSAEKIVLHKGGAISSGEVPETSHSHQAGKSR